MIYCVGDKCPIRTTPYIYHEGQWGPVHKTNFITNWDYPVQFIICIAFISLLIVNVTNMYVDTMDDKEKEK